MSHFVCFKCLERHISESVPVEDVNLLPEPLQVPIHPLYFSAYFLDVCGWVTSFYGPVKVDLSEVSENDEKLTSMSLRARKVRLYYLVRASLSCL